MCTGAYREALTRDLSSTASSAPAPSQRHHATEASPEGVAGRAASHVVDPLRIANSDETRSVLNGTNGTTSATSPEESARARGGMIESPPTRLGTDTSTRMTRQLNADNDKSADTITWTPTSSRGQDTGYAIKLRFGLCLCVLSAPRWRRPSQRWRRAWRSPGLGGECVKVVVAAREVTGGGCLASSGCGWLGRADSCMIPVRSGGRVGGLTRPPARRQASAVPQGGRLVAQLPGRRHELPIGSGLHRCRGESYHPVAVLEGQPHAEVPFQAASDRVACHGT